MMKTKTVKEKMCVEPRITDWSQICRIFLWRSRAQEEGPSKWNWLLQTKSQYDGKIDLSDYVEGRAQHQLLSDVEVQQQKEAATYQTCPSEKDKSKKVKSKWTFVQLEQTFSVLNERARLRSVIWNMNRAVFCCLLWLKWDSAGAGTLKWADVMLVLCSCCLSTQLKVEFSQWVSATLGAN